LVLVDEVEQRVAYELDQVDLVKTCAAGAVRALGVWTVFTRRSKPAAMRSTSA
jgi:hypothetical protein